MCVDHLTKLLHHVVEGVIVSSHVVLSDSLVESSQPQQGHDISVSATNSYV